jgi:solute carrier family 6 amino acid transporter-like protein 5/7/9/14
LDSKYFDEEFLGKSDSIEEIGELNWPIWILYIISLVICFYIVKKGVKTSGRIAIFTATIPYLFFIILLIRGIFLEGAS